MALHASMHMAPIGGSKHCHGPSHGHLGSSILLYFLHAGNFEDGKEATTEIESWILLEMLECQSKKRKREGGGGEQEENEHIEVQDLPRKEKEEEQETFVDTLIDPPRKDGGAEEEEEETFVDTLIAVQPREEGGGAEEEEEKKEATEEEEVVPTEIDSETEEGEGDDVVEEPAVEEVVVLSDEEEEVGEEPGEDGVYPVTEKRLAEFSPLCWSLQTTEWHRRWALVAKEYWRRHNIQREGMRARAMRKARFGPPL